MKSVIWQSGQRIIKQVLDWFSSAQSDNLKGQRQDFYQSGVLLGSLNELDIIVGTNNTPSTPSVTIRTGTAYDPTGERIVVADETISYDATNPSDTTDNGLGTQVPTPHSTGSKNIPLTVNSQNYLWIDYLATTDESVFTIQQAINAKQFYKQTDGYIITVTTVNTPPTANSVFLGSVNLTSFGVVSGTTISKTGRANSLIQENRIKIHTPMSNLSDATTSYSWNEDHTLDDHIKAVGTGTVTPQNPHGMSVTDLGLDVSSLVATHQKFMHSNGIIGSRTSTSSSLYCEVHTITPGDDFVVIKAFTTSEVANVDGTTVTNSDIPSDVTFLFSSIGDLMGTYYIYLDKFTKSLIRTTVNPSSDSTKLPLWSMFWTPGTNPLYDGNLTSVTDLRVFGTIDNTKINNKDSYDLFRVRLEDGTAAAPSLTWQSETTMGFYRVGSSAMGISVGSAEISHWNSSGLNIDSGVIYNTDGVLGIPSYSFTGSPSMGFYRKGSNDLGIVTNGILAIEVDSSQNVLSGASGTQNLGSTSQYWNTFYSNTHQLMSDGVVGAPAITWNADSDTGIYRVSSGLTAFSTNGNQSMTIGDYVSATRSGIATVDGAAGTPSFTFSSDSDTGIYHFTTNSFALTSGGTVRWVLNATGSLSSSNNSLFYSGDGSVSSPGISFSSDTSTGFYRPSASQINVALGGTSKLAISTTTLDASNLIFYVANGSAAAPALAFGSNTNTGFYRVGSNEVGLALGGSLVADFKTTTTSFTSALSATGTGFTNVAYQFGAANTGLTGSGEIDFIVSGTEKMVVGSSVISFVGFTAGSSFGSGIGAYFFSNAQHGGNTNIRNDSYNTADHLTLNVNSLTRLLVEDELGSNQYRATSNSQGHQFIINTGVDNEIVRINSTNILPGTDNVVSLGSNARRYVAVFAVNGTIQTSHSLTKSNIIDVNPDELEIPRGVYYERDGRKWLGYLNDSIPDEGRPLNEDGSIDTTANYEQAVIGVLCATVRQLKEDNKKMKEQIKMLLDSKE